MMNVPEERDITIIIKGVDHVLELASSIIAFQYHSCYGFKKEAEGNNDELHWRLE